MGDGNISTTSAACADIIVGTAVNPHGGWKQLVESTSNIVFLLVGTAVNPHGGWKLTITPTTAPNTPPLGRPLILMGDGNATISLPVRASYKGWDGR